MAAILSRPQCVNMFRQVSFTHIRQGYIADIWDNRPVASVLMNGSTENNVKNKTNANAWYRGYPTSARKRDTQ